MQTCGPKHNVYIRTLTGAGEIINQVAQQVVQLAGVIAGEAHAWDHPTLARLHSYRYSFYND